MKSIIFLIAITLIGNSFAKEAHHQAPAKHEVTTHAAASSGAHQVEPGVAPETALGWLQNGNSRFVQGKFRKDGQGPKDRKKLVSGQKPHTIILSCSDSRVPPEIIFDQKLGEIFIVRTAGQALDSVGLASMEYAIEHLGSKLLLVLGHESCGAVKAAISTLDGKSAGSPSLDALVADIHPRIRHIVAKTKGQDKGVLEEVDGNAKGIIEDLKTRSAIVKEKVERGELMVRYAIYHLDSGRVEFQ